jgi:hypothetical protein
MDVLKIVRENQEKFKEHLQKIKELEEKEKELNYFNLYRNYNQNNPKDRLTTIPEGENETYSIKKNTHNYDEVDSNYNRKSDQNSLIYNKYLDVNNEYGRGGKSDYIYREINEDEGDSAGENQPNINYRNEASGNNSNIINEKLNKENDYIISKEEEKNENYRSDEESYEYKNKRNYEESKGFKNEENTEEEDEGGEDYDNNKNELGERTDEDEDEVEVKKYGDQKERM